MQFFVYYSDGYYENGDIGMKVFGSREEAATFITERMAKATMPSVADYIVIQGVPLQVKPIEYALRVDLVPATLGPDHLKECGTAYRGCAPECSYQSAHATESTR